MTFTAEQLKMLSAKLDQSHVKPPSANGPKGDYLEGWFVIAEANRIFGFGGWSYEIVSLTTCHDPIKNEKGNFGVSYIARIKVAVGDVVREDVGYGSGWSRQIGDAFESASKESITDALKRCLRTFGNPFGLALYDKSRENVADGAEIARNEALESLWSELCSIRTEAGLKSFWTDNAKSVSKMDEFNRQRFTKKKDELKAKFEDDRFPGDTDITDASGRRLHTMEG